MELNMSKELASLPRTPIGELRARYAEVFGEGTSANHRDWLIKRIAWRLQALAEGDLSERARQRATELANDADFRLSPPQQSKPKALPVERVQPVPIPPKGDKRLPMPGSIITRTYKGRPLYVKVLPDGFEFEGENYKSLSAVAKAITGSHCNGFLFFKFAKEGGER